MVDEPAGHVMRGEAIAGRRRLLMFRRTTELHRQVLGPVFHWARAYADTRPDPRTDTPAARRGHPSAIYTHISSLDTCSFSPRRRSQDPPVPSGGCRLRTLHDVHPEQQLALDELVPVRPGVIGPALDGPRAHEDERTPPTGAPEAHRGGTGDGHRQAHAPTVDPGPAGVLGRRGPRSGVSRTGDVAARPRRRSYPVGTSLASPSLASALDGGPENTRSGGDPRYADRGGSVIPRTGKSGGRDGNWSCVRYVYRRASESERWTPSRGCCVWIAGVLRIAPRGSPLVEPGGSQKVPPNLTHPSGAMWWHSSRV